MKKEVAITEQKTSESKTGFDKKRTQFVADGQKKKRLNPWVIIVLLVVAGVAAYFVARSTSSTPTASTVTKGDSSGAAAISIPIADLASGKAKFFDYKLANNTPVRFFAVKSSDGVYRAAMDACDVCYHAKKGYYQEGDDMICKNCSKHFPIKFIGEVNGGCHPIGLPRTVEGEQLVIQASELESRGHYFQ